MRVPTKKILSQVIPLLLVQSIFVAWNPSSTTAQVFISEVYPAPASGESEWVELCNSSQEVVELSGNYLMDQLSTPSVLLTFTNQSINPLSALVVNITGAKLNNTGDSVVLLSPNNQIIDQVDYSDSTTSQSFSRQSKDQSLSLSFSNPQLCLPEHFPPTPIPTSTPSPLPTPTITPTPAANLFPTSTSTPKPTTSPTPTPKLSQSPTALPTPIVTNHPISSFPADQFTTLVEVSEIMACPEAGNGEWLELYNFSNSSIDLTDWYVLDAVNNRIDLSIVIAANSYGVIEFSRAVINNSGDSISILSPDGTIRWQSNLGACTTGKSFMLFGGQYILGTPTPNVANTNLNSLSASTTASTNNPSTTSALPNSTSSFIDSSTPVLLKTSSTIGEKIWPDELGQVLGDVEDLTWPRLLESHSATPSASTNPPSSHSNFASLPTAHFAYHALFGSSLGGLIMISSGLILTYANWKNHMETTW